ncbi:MAG: hypothetical protein Q8P83_03540 [bacterium]|nr:hypothetical protein [bacterium]
MLTKEDIKLLTESLAGRKEMDEGFRLVAESFDDLESQVRILQTSVDNLAKLVKDFRDEHIIIHRRLEILEKWAKLAAAKLGIELPQ